VASLVEKELSYAIVGVLLDIQKELGGGYQEKYYQRAIASGLKAKRILFVEQVSVPLSYQGDAIGRYFLDFLVENKVVLEVKAGSKLYVRDTRQVLSYLKAQNIPLGILANFARKGVSIKRILKGSR